MAARTEARSSTSTACQRTEPCVAGGEPPGRCHATMSRPCGASRSSRWLPAKPAAPVTSVGRGIDNRSARHPAQPAAERREIAQAGERKRKEEAMVGRHGERRDALQIVLLVLECQAAALGVVERGDPLLDEVRMEDVVVERVVR